MNIIEIHTSDGTSYKLLSEKEIISYLENLIVCPFCDGSGFWKGEKLFSSFHITCKNCGFRLSSHNLYVDSKVVEGMNSVEIVLSDSIRNEVKDYLKTLRGELLNIELRKSAVMKKLELHFKI